jgi:hypothetical protein
MAGKAVVNKVQLGDSTTATQNFVLQTNVDGTATLARGNDGATTQDVVTINSSGVVSFPQGIGTGLPANIVNTFNTRTGTVTLTSSDVTTALGFTPVGIDPGYGAIGSLVFAYSTATVASGGTIAGSSLKAACVYGTSTQIQVASGTGEWDMFFNATALTGTWRCLGYATAANNLTLYQRTA